MIQNWMAWEGGVDLVAMTSAELKTPNLILHVARMVHTPVGSAPSGLLFWQPKPDEAPQIMGFVSTDATVGAYFGPHIFAGTPFENAPILLAEMSFEIAETFVAARIVVDGFVFESRLANLQNPQTIQREIGAMPFKQSGIEAIANEVTLKVNGENVDLVVPEIGISGGAGAVFAPCGIYAR